mgnify:CR=1 FL=1
MERTDFKVIIAGTRDFADYELLKEKCDAILSNRRNDSSIVIVSGTARGADRLGERYARERGYRIERYPADWDRDGNSAGPIRNAKMADNANALIAFWDGRSRGTKNMIDTAKAKGLMVRTIITSTNILQESQEAKIQHPSGTMAELDLFGKKDDVNNNVLLSDSLMEYNKVEGMKEKNVISEDKEYQPGDVIEIPKVKKLREQTSQYAIEHITRKGLHTGYAWVRDAFNDYYDAIKTPGAKISAESDIAHRELLAQKVAIDCIHKLNHEQLQQLDKVLKEIVSENNLSNGLHR